MFNGYDVGIPTVRANSIWESDYGKRSCHLSYSEFTTNLRFLKVCQNFPRRLPAAEIVESDRMLCGYLHSARGPSFRECNASPRDALRQTGWAPHPVLFVRSIETMGLSAAISAKVCFGRSITNGTIVGAILGCVSWVTSDLMINQNRYTQCLVKALYSLLVPHLRYFC